MPIRTSHVEHTNRFYLIFEGNVDVSIGLTLCNFCKRVPAGLETCILDLRGINRVFDSGVELLRVLYQRLDELGIEIVLLSHNPQIKKQLPYITGRL